MLVYACACMFTACKTLKKIWREHALLHAILAYARPPVTHMTREWCTSWTHTWFATQHVWCTGRVGMYKQRNALVLLLGSFSNSALPLKKHTGMSLLINMWKRKFYWKSLARESLVNLANHLWFVKLKPFKLVFLINNPFGWSIHLSNFFSPNT